MHPAVSLAARFAEGLLAASRTEGNLLAAIGAGEVVGCLAARSGVETEDASAWLVAVPAPGKLGASGPNLEEVDKVSTLGDLVDISRPQSAVHMNELVDLERNETACDSKLAF